MLRLNINGQLYEVDEKYLVPVAYPEVYDVEFTEEKVEEEN